MDTQKEATPEVVNLKCRNPMKACPSMTATKVEHPSKTLRLYQCTACKHTWPISVGGEFNVGSL
jgi:transposase-like protein